MPCLYLYFEINFSSWHFTIMLKRSGITRAPENSLVNLGDTKCFKYKLKMFRFWNCCLMHCCSSCLIQGGEWLWWRRGIIKYWGGWWFSYETVRTYSIPLNRRETFESGIYVIESHSLLIPTHILVLFAESEGADIHAQWRYHGRRVETRTASVGGQSYACHHDCHQGSCICCKLTVYFFFSLVIFIFI